MVQYDYTLESSKGGEFIIEVHAEVEFGQKAERGEDGLPTELDSSDRVAAWTMHWKNARGAYVGLINASSLPPAMQAEIEEEVITAAYDKANNDENFS